MIKGEDQIRNVFRYLDETQSEEVKKTVFQRLGHECFFSTGAVSWVKQFGGDIQAFLDRVNVQHLSPYWESLELSEDGSELVLTGKIVNDCVCPYTTETDRPLSLCDYCCRHFQEVLFSELFGKQAQVSVTSSFLKGDKRCNTLIRFV